jgi:hypothetical protein
MVSLMRNGRELVAIFKIAQRTQAILTRKMVFLIRKAAILVAKLKIAQIFLANLMRERVSLTSY